MRACEDCQTCCTIPAIKEGVVDKPAWQRCVHQCATGCAIYTAQIGRPQVCADFRCAWHGGVGADDARPNKVGAMFWIRKTDNGHVGFAIELVANALRTTAQEMAVDFVRQTRLPLIVSLHDRRPPDDVGDLLVLKREHVLRAIAMRGPYVATLAPDVMVYEFAFARAG
ncbi:MAG: hypothetical protein EPN91_02810 [Salinibacterium sp.]|nr:MAG: hypothetical protein EPN91_02810 [Salinibacterium sp.]